MKKLILSCVLTLATAFCSYADADLTYRFNDDDQTCEVYKAYSVSGHVNIPSSVERNGKQYKVISIGDYAFKECSELTSVTIPESVTSIGYAAFSSCENLAEITIPESVTSIGDYAFLYCENIIYNAINATCGKNIFGLSEYDYNHIKIQFGPNVKNAPQKEAYGDTERTKTKVTIEFSQGMESIYIPSCTSKIILHLSDIDDWAINTPEGYSSCWWNELNSGSEFRANQYEQDWVAVTADFNGSPIKNITFGSKVNKIGINAFAGFIGLQSVTFSEYLKEIGEGAFCNTSISSVLLPETTSAIGDFAFAECEKLSEVKLPTELTSFGKGAFYDCTALYNVKLSDEMKEVPEYAFYGCTDLETIELPKNLISIGNYAFNNCKKLKTIKFPDCLETIGDYAFYDIPFSGELKFGNALLSIGSHAFERVVNNSSSRNEDLIVKLSEGIQSIGVFAFYNSILRNINLPESLNYIGRDAFSGTKLTSIVIPNGITEIKPYTFYNTDLTTVTLPQNLETIGAGAFMDTKLSEINLPESLTTIGGGAFSETPLVNCVIPDKLT